MFPSHVADGYLISDSQPPRFAPIVLAATKTPEAAAWMEEMQETGSLLDGILAVTHPDLYHAGRHLMQKLYSHNARARPVVSTWPSFFHAVHIIVNRETILHRDTNGLPGWYDLLLSVGSYGEAAVFTMRTFGVSVPYDSGSVVMVCSRIIAHGVPAVPADRICLAWLMKENILSFHNVQGAQWRTL